MVEDIEVEESEIPTNLEAIKKFEELIKVKLPEDYKQFLLKHNGGHPIRDTFRLIEPINDHFNEGGISWFYALYDGDVCNITTNFKHSLARGESPDKFLPIGYDSGGGNEICIELIEGDDYGKLYYWTTDWSVWTKDEYNYLYLIANSFTDFINDLYEDDI